MSMMKFVRGQKVRVVKSLARATDFLVGQPVVVEIVNANLLYPYSCSKIQVDGRVDTTLHVFCDDELCAESDLVAPQPITMSLLYERFGPACFVKDASHRIYKVISLDTLGVVPIDGGARLQVSTCCVSPALKEDLAAHETLLHLRKANELQEVVARKTAELEDAKKQLLAHNAQNK